MITRLRTPWKAVCLIAACLLVALAVWFRVSRDPVAPRPPAPADAPPRIVVMSPGIAVILRDLGLSDPVVGRHEYDLVLPRSVPSCGDEKGLEYETLLRINPTHLLFQQDARGSPGRLRELAERHGWDVRVYELLRLDDIEHCIQDLHWRFVARPRYIAEGVDADALLTAEAGGPARSDLQRRWAQAMSFRGRHLAEAGRVLLLGAVSPPSALGPGSWHHQILERIGGTPAITDGAPWITLDAEDVLRLSPDAIVLILPRAPDSAPGPPPTAAELKDLLGRVGTLDIPAVESGRIAIIDDPLAHTPSTAMIGLADELARILEDWSR